MENPLVPLTPDVKLKLTRIQALKAYFGTERPVENREIMALSIEDRRELGAACLSALGAELQEVV